MKTKQQLPDELLYEVVKYLGVFKEANDLMMNEFAHIASSSTASNFRFKTLNKDFVSCSLVCGRWYQLLHDPIIWRGEVLECEADLKRLINEASPSVNKEEEHLVIDMANYQTESESEQWLEKVTCAREELENELQSLEVVDHTFFQKFFKFKNYQLKLWEKKEEELNNAVWTDQTHVVRENPTRFDSFLGTILLLLIFWGIRDVIIDGYPSMAIFYIIAGALLVQFIASVWQLVRMVSFSMKYRTFMKTVKFFSHNRQKIVFMSSLFVCMSNIVSNVCFIYVMSRTETKGLSAVFKSGLFILFTFVSAVGANEFQNMKKISQGTIYVGSYTLFVLFERTLALNRSVLFLFLFDFVSMIFAVGYQEHRIPCMKWTAFAFELLVIFIYWTNDPLINLMLLAMSGLYLITTHLRWYKLYRI